MRVEDPGVLRDDLGMLAGAPVTDAALNASIRVFNDNRAAVRDLYAYRAAKPWQAPTSEGYLVLRAGMVLPVEEHTGLVRDYLAAADAVARPKRESSSAGVPRSTIRPWRIIRTWSQSRSTSAMLCEASRMVAQVSRRYASR